MAVEYFSDEQTGLRARTTDIIGEAPWGGIVALVGSLVASGAFGADFPADCPDGAGICGTNETTFSLALRAEIPDVAWPLKASEVPETLAVLDLVQFCYEHVAKLEAFSFHSSFRHDHLNFDREQGRAEFLSRVERIFSRNRLAYELKADGQIVRLAPEGLREALGSSPFRSGEELDGLLEGARAKFLSPDPSMRRESLEKLWDAFERLKSLEDPKDKRASAASLLEQVSSEATFRARLDAEARELTNIGNGFRIRHSETTQVPLKLDEHVDYLFHCLFACRPSVARLRIAEAHWPADVSATRCQSHLAEAFQPAPVRIVISGPGALPHSG